MTSLHALLFGIIQGITEFIPISSTAHLHLAAKLLDLPQQDKLFDVVLHAGTLLAVLIFFYRDIMEMIVATLGSIFGSPTTPFHKAMNLVISTIPVLVSGGVVTLFNIQFPEKSLPLNLIVFGVLLVVADQWGRRNFKVAQLTPMNALFIGAFQALAVVPGISRLGACLIGCLLVGLSRVEAMKYSFLLSIPTVLGAVTLTAGKAVAKGTFVWDHTMTLAVVSTFIVALVTMRAILSWIEQNSFRVIGLYRVILGVLLF